MAALVQPYSQQSSTVTMFQTRNGSGPGMMPAPPQQNQQYSGAQQRGGNYHTSGAPMAYRGSTAAIQPYAFTSTPSLNTPGQRQSHQVRAHSSTAVPTAQGVDHNNGSFPRSRHAANASLPNLPLSMSGGSRDDSALPPPGTRRGSGTSRPQSAYFASSTVQTSFASAAPAKNQPDRYRRPAQRTSDTSSSGSQTHPQGSAPPSGSGMASVSHLYTPPPNANKERRPSPSNLNRPNSFYAKVPGTVDDMQLYRTPEEARKIRRRSMPALDTTDLPRSLAALDIRKVEKSPLDQSAPKLSKEKDQITKTARLVTITNPTSSVNLRNGSSESLVSSRSSHSRPSSVSSPIRSQTPGSPTQSQALHSPGLSQLDVR